MMLFFLILVCAASAARALRVTPPQASVWGFVLANPNYPSCEFEVVASDGDVVTVTDGVSVFACSIEHAYNLGMELYDG